MLSHLAVNTTANEEMLRRIHQRLAGGSCSNLRARGFNVPITVSRASGSRIWDLDGNEIIDLNMGYGTHIFGYADPIVAEAVREQMTQGAMTGLPHRLDLQASELIAELVPSVGQVRFANSGTEALMSSVRLARMSTGRTLVVTFEGQYHGWSDTLFCRPVLPGTKPKRLEPGPEPGTPGMIPESLAHTLQIPWNDPESLREVFARYGPQIAAVLCAPVLANAGVILPAPGFLELARELTSRRGAMLIYDEVITGFRVARNCGQGRYRVYPDLTVVSKVMGGGFPVAAFGGSRATMAPLARNEAFHAGVYSGNHSALAAVVSMLTRIKSNPDIYDWLETLGAYADTRLRTVFAEAGRHVWIGRVGSLMSVALTSRQLSPAEELVSAPAAIDFAGHRELQARCQQAGVYFHPDPTQAWFLSTAHTAEDIDTVCETIGKALVSLPESCPSQSTEGEFLWWS